MARDSHMLVQIDMEVYMIYKKEDLLHIISLPLNLITNIDRVNMIIDFYYY